MKRSIRSINRHGILLVFPINNRPEPLSLWSVLHPQEKMRWEWSDEGDNKVANLWLLMKKLSSCRDVVYSKWYQGRATFFSRDVFTAMLCLARESGGLKRSLPFQAREILDLLEADSPLSTKQIKEAVGLQGRLNEPHYSRAMKLLFSRLQIVAFGEVDDGAFPSLAVGATQTLFEDLWRDSIKMSQQKALSLLAPVMPAGGLLQKYFGKFLLEQLNSSDD